MRDGLAIENLRDADRALGASLHRLRSWSGPASNFPQQGFSTLRREIVRAGDAMRSLNHHAPGDPAVGKLITECRDHLQQIAQILPVVHGALQARRDRLKAGLDHLQTVAAWADANRESL